MTPRTVVGLLAVLLAISGAGGPARAQEPQGLQVRGAVIDGALMVALRDVFPYLGFTGEWDATSQSSLLRSPRGSLRVTVDSTTATWYPAATGVAVKASIAQAPEMVSGTVVGPLTSLLRAAGIAYTVLEHTEGLTRFVVQGKNLTVLHGAQSGPSPQPGPRPQPNLPAPSRPPAPQPTDPDLTSRAIDGETPQLIMRNDSSRVVTIRLAKDGLQLLWQVPPDKTVAARPIDPGTWKYEASAPGVRGSSGERTFEPYTEYTWKWWVQ